MKKNFDTLVVGGVYRTRAGLLDTVVEFDGYDGIYPYKTHIGWYTSGGNFYSDTSESRYDLMEFVRMGTDVLLDTQNKQTKTKSPLVIQFEDGYTMTLDSLLHAPKNQKYKILPN